MSKFLRVGFYLLGTFLLLFSSIIVGANFVKDSSVFEKSVVEVKKQPVKQQEVAAETSTAPKTLYVESNQDKDEPAKDTAKDTAADSTAEVTDKKNLAVEVINCTGKKGLAEDTRTMLEAKGYQVSAASGNEAGTSRIIIRKKGINVDKISSMFKISVVKEELQPKSRFDVTVIIGTDYNP